MTQWFLGLSATAMFLALLTPAQAAIRCQDGFQIIGRGETVASPYCQELNLATVARKSYGISTSLRRIRASETEKQQICQAIGSDPRVQSICHGYRPGSEDIRQR